jgi:hypothetical protein
VKIDGPDIVAGIEIMVVVGAGRCWDAEISRIRIWESWAEQLGVRTCGCVGGI